MAADRYQLAAVRDARERDERGKRGELAASVGDAREARARLEAAQRRTELARTALTVAVTAREALVAAGSTTPGQITNAERYVMRRRRELDAALGEELRAHISHEGQQAAVDVQRQLLARARADREVIDRHFARWRESRKKLAERRED